MLYVIVNKVSSPSLRFSLLRLYRSFPLTIQTTPFSLDGFTPPIIISELRSASAVGSSLTPMVSLHPTPYSLIHHLPQRPLRSYLTTSSPSCALTPTYSTQPLSIRGTSILLSQYLIAVSNDRSSCSVTVVPFKISNVATSSRTVGRFASGCNSSSCEFLSVFTAITWRMYWRPIACCQPAGFLSNPRSC